MFSLRLISLVCWTSTNVVIPSLILSITRISYCALEFRSTAIVDGNGWVGVSERYLNTTYFDMARKALQSMTGYVCKFGQGLGVMVHRRPN